LGRHVFFTLARYTPSGHLDPSFGADGKVVNKSLGAAGGLAIQSDGKVVVLAVRSSSSNAPLGSVLVRYTTDGRLDESFGKSALAAAPTTGAGALLVATLGPGGQERPARERLDQRTCHPSPQR
jgi:hypothetical protein